MNNTTTQTELHSSAKRVHDTSINFAKVADGKRVITIAYRLFPEKRTQNIEYAASVFRKDNEKETYNRRQHVQTARGRLAVRPLNTTFEFSRDMLDNLFERNVPRDKEQRRVWSRTEEGEKWRELRREMDANIATFLRKEVAKHGVRAKDRLRRSDIESRKVFRKLDVSEVTELLSRLSSESNDAKRKK